MSRFQSHLNAQQKKQFLSPQGKSSARTSKASRVLSVLSHHDFQICQIVERKTHMWIRLGCGAIVSVYVTGTVLVQGRIYGCGAAEAEQMLRQVLPAPLVWKARVDT